MGLFSSFSDFLTGSVGNNLDNDEDDVRNTKRNLKNTGHLDDNVENGYATRELDEGIKSFQRDNSLKIDGALLPGGETERGLFGTLTGRSADTAFGRKSEKNDGNIIGFGGNVSGISERKETTYKPPKYAKIFMPSLETEKEEVEKDGSFTLTRGGMRVNKDKIADGIEKFLLGAAQGEEAPLPTTKPEISEEKAPPSPEKKPVPPEVLKPSFDLKKAPIFKDKKSRQEVLLKNLPAKFNIRDKPSLKNKKMKERIANSIKNDKIAAKTVQEHDVVIERLSKKHGVDPNIIRSIMWTENSRGDYFSVNRLAGKIGVSKSQTPLNINGNLWAPLIGEKSKPLNNAEENIEAGVILVKRIGDRIEDPTAAKIGSIWNYAGRELTSDFGVAIGEAFEQKPWEK